MPIEDSADANRIQKALNSRRDPNMNIASGAASPVLLTRDSDGVTHFILNRPDKRNALSTDLLHAVKAELDRVEKDERIRVIIVASEGPVFCAGHDLGEMIGCSREKYNELFALCSRV